MRELAGLRSLLSYEMQNISEKTRKTVAGTRTWVLATDEESSIEIPRIILETQKMIDSAKILLFFLWGIGLICTSGRRVCFVQYWTRKLSEDSLESTRQVEMNDMKLEH